MKKIVTLSLILIVSVAAMSQKRPFTIKDLYAIPAVAEPQISPDGKRVAFVVTEQFLEKGKSNADIYVMDLNGSNQARLTNNLAYDGNPRWSPDGTSLLFLSTRSGSMQAWLLPMSGGDPLQVTDISTGVSDPVWFSDSKKFAFSSQVFPECGADDECNKKNNATMQKGPIRAYMSDVLLYRHWDSWKEGKRTHTFIYFLDKKSVVDLTPGDFESPSFSLGGVGYATDPAGRELCFVSNRDKVEAVSTNKDLWVVPIEGGVPVNITASNPAYDGDPAYSPDGRYIAYKTQLIPGYESDKFRIALYDRQKKTSSIMTEDFDNWVNDIKWSRDSKTIFFTADVQGTVPIYALDIASKRIRLVLNARTIDAFDVSPDGKTLVYRRRSVAEPAELWSVGVDGKNPKRLTFFTKSVADEVDIRPAEEMWIQSPTGKKIHTFVVKPHNFDPNKKYPLILNVHGGPQSQWADAFRGDWQVYPGAGYIVAFPNPHGSTGYGQEFTRAISRDWGGKVYEDVMAVTDSLAKLPYVDSDRLGAMGWSYGGYMMMWLQGRTTKFKAMAAMMGVYNLTAMHGSTEELWFPQFDLGGTPYESEDYTKWSPNQFVKNFKTPCLVITGELDYRVSYTQSLEFFTDLQLMGVPSRLLVFPNDGHWPNGIKSMPLYYNAHLDWFHKYLGGDPAPYDMVRMIRNQAFTE